jgi:hypothetical protein
MAVIVSQSLVEHDAIAQRYFVLEFFQLLLFACHLNAPFCRLLFRK